METFNSSVHGNINESVQVVSTEICFDKDERLAKRVHKTRAEIEPTCSHNRSAILPLKYSIFFPLLSRIAYRNIHTASAFTRTIMNILNVYRKSYSTRSKRLKATVARCVNAEKCRKWAFCSHYRQLRLWP